MGSLSVFHIGTLCLIPVPTVIAILRRNPKVWLVALVSLLTVLGWLLALVLALTQQPKVLDPPSSVG